MLESLLTDQRTRWGRGERVSVSSYVEKHAELQTDSRLLGELIKNEISIREALGETISIEEYLRAFPQCHAVIAPILLRPQKGAPSISQFATAMPEAEDAKAFATMPGSDATVELQATPNMVNQASGPFETLATDPSASAQRATNDSGRFPRVPGFEITGELGRGGMGVVYKARQISTRRTVALKIVRNDLLDTLAPSSRKATLERFSTEAQAAACLQHDNVVSVYEVGEVPSSNAGASPLHYYAMRFVKGQSLFDILRDGPLENRRAASYIHQVALALQAAHDQGILHRDLKPHNIMVEERTDRPLVTDFGLAKFVEGQNSITYAGQVMGTPAYMSPEQAQDAASVTPSADQYSIGATLYHLLTGRPPFQAANIAETIRQIIDKQPVALRQLNAGIHRDLETICLKSIHKDPSRRYESCQELAQDLQRYLQGRPIVARPVGRLERSWRWCQRNPIPASLTATAALFLLAFMASIVIGYRNTSSALAISESRLQKALQVVDELFTRVSEDELLNEPGMQPLRAELLEKALKHYEYFLSESSSNTKLSEEVAAAHFRVGMIYQVTRRLEDAERELQLARQQQLNLMDQFPSSDAPIKALADTCNALGSVYSKQSRNGDAIDMLEQSASLRTRLVERQPTNTEYRRLLSNATMNLGLVRVDQKQVDPGQVDQQQTDQQQIDQGLSEMQLAQSMRIDLLKSEPDSVRLQRDLALGWYSIGKNQAELGRLEDASVALKQGVAIFRELAQNDARSLSGRYRLVVALTLFGGVLAEQGNSMEATDVYEEALIPVQSLALSNPEVPDYQHAWLDLLLRLGIEYANQENLDRSAEVRKQALELATRLSEEDPDNTILLSDMAYCLGSLGDTERRRDRLSEAKGYYTQANVILNRMLEQDPDSEDLKKQLKQNEQELTSIEDR